VPVRRTKLVCTLGPATDAIVDDLVRVGMDVARINFSHGTPADHARRAASVARSAAAAHRHVAVLADLPGPKIRLGTLPGGRVTLAAGESFTLRPASGAVAAGGATTTYPSLADDIRPGDRILLADGAAELRALSARDGAVVTEVVRGGTVRSRQGISIPSERLSTPAVTERDRIALPRALELGADYIAQSFVRRAADIDVLRRELIGAPRVPIVAKIETRSAIDHLDEILDACDALMVARGDLGVEIPFEQVPMVQKQMLRRAAERGVPTIVATQMLESMIEAPRPTRAEASDVANAVLDGADALMLSGETAAGSYPLEAAAAAVAIAKAAEDAVQAAVAGPEGDPASSDRAIAHAAVALVHATPGVAAIVCFTRSGRTAMLLSSLRPRVPIVAFSPEATVLRRLALWHGVVPVAVEPSDRTVRLVPLLDGALRGALGLTDEATIVLVRTTSSPDGRNELQLVRLGAARVPPPD
jgi:pyruvate kinase